MPELPRKKVGLVSCSGEEMPEGTVTRLATLKVLETLRPDDTVTICLPLFLAGGEGERSFARFHPTITIDGCDKRCAAKGTELYSGKPAATIVVTDFLRSPSTELGTARCLSDSGKLIVAGVAEEIARNVDRLVTGTHKVRPDMAGLGEAATCSCGSGVPVAVLEICGRSVEVLALPAIFDMFHQSGKPPGKGTDAELMETVRLYNAVPDHETSQWEEVISREYAVFFQREVR